MFIFLYVNVFQKMSNNRLGGLLPCMLSNQSQSWAAYLIPDGTRGVVPDLRNKRKSCTPPAVAPQAKNKNIKNKLKMGPVYNFMTTLSPPLCYHIFVKLNFPIILLILLLKILFYF